MYAVLVRFWPILFRVFGWFFIPVGQASLYVFVMHLVGVACLAGAWAQAHGSVVNTLLHALVLLGLWGCVKSRFLFGVIPR
jgi:hypothetical protein